MKTIIRISLFLIFAGIVTQGFQCSSAEMTNGNIALKDAKQSGDVEDWKKAASYYEAEVQKRPNNGDAWFKLVEVRQHLEDVPGTIEAMDKAAANLQNPNYQDILKQRKYNMWIDMYNKGYNYLDSTRAAKSESLKRQYADKAVRYTDFALQLKPDNYEPILVKSYVQDEIGDRDTYVKTLEMYVGKTKDYVDIYRANRLQHRISRERALQSLGQPDETGGDRLGEADSIVIDQYAALNGHKALLFYREDGGEFLLRGMRLDPPADWLEAEAKRYTDFDVSVFPVLAFEFYDRKNYDKSKDYLNTALLLNPADENALRLQTAIIEETGSAEEALEATRKLVEEFPTDKLYLGQYGTMLANIGRYDDAITYFEKALAQDARYDIALYNIGAAYKNKASEIQKEEQAKQEEDESYEIKEDRYLPMLRTAAENFEKYRALPGKDRDFQVIEQLVNIYQVTLDADKSKRLIAELEGLEYKYKDNPGYYEFLAQYYLKNDQVAKSQEAFDKADKLRGQ